MPAEALVHVSEKKWEDIAEHMVVESSLVPRVANPCGLGTGHETSYYIKSCMEVR